LGEVYRPENVVHGKEKPVPGLIPTPIPQPITPTRLEELSRDIESIKVELAKIKLALRANGIAIE
jgi:hypothetical protein